MQHIRDGLQTHVTVMQRYRHLVQAGVLLPDPAQEVICRALDRLLDAVQEKRLAAKSSALGWLFARRRGAAETVRGLYIHGGVGRGKTMLMDIFFDLLNMRRKRRAHFNDFMADVHDRIHRHRLDRKAGRNNQDDPIPPVARALAAEARVLCFDEFAVTDIADAMILSRLFAALFAEGVVLVATSNVAPEDLYKDGLNRALFTPFIGILRRHAEILAVDAGTDYRIDKGGHMPAYLTPADEAAGQRMDAAWSAIAGQAGDQQAEIRLKGRRIVVPRATDKAARFRFSDLCEKPLGARDFLAIAARYPTIFIDAVPVMAEDRRNEAKRFILLVDTLYDKGIRLVVSAAAPPAGLYAGKKGTEAFEFNRTASRLIEMQGEAWLADWLLRHGEA